jgi:hypothetical protein
VRWLLSLPQLLRLLSVLVHQLLRLLLMPLLHLLLGRFVRVALRELLMFLILLLLQFLPFLILPRAQFFLLLLILLVQLGATCFAANAVARIEGRNFRWNVLPTSIGMYAGPKRVFSRCVMISSAGPSRLSCALPKARWRWLVFYFLLCRLYHPCRSAVSLGSLAARHAPRSCPLPCRTLPSNFSSFGLCRISARAFCVPTIVSTSGEERHTLKRVARDHENLYQRVRKYFRRRG